MRAIWKFTLKVAGRQGVSVPRDAVPLSAQMQDDTLCVWCLVDPKAKSETVTVAIVGTGHAFDPTGWEFVGTVQQGAFVWHVFWPEPA